MTPFDPWALLAMLLAFYPTPTVASLQRARRERPEYFSGGRLVSTGGEKLELPDGRVFDLIFDVGGPRARWQATEVFPGGSDADDPFPLEPGPLALLDPFTWPEPTGEPIFEPLVAAALLELGAVDDAVGHAHTLMSEHASPAALEAVYADTIGAAEGRLLEHGYALDAAAPDDVLAETDSFGHVVEQRDEEYTALAFETPPDLPPVDSGSAPDDEPGPGGGPLPV